MSMSWARCCESAATSSRLNKDDGNQIYRLTTGKYIAQYTGWQLSHCRSIQSSELQITLDQALVFCSVLLLPVLRIVARRDMYDNACSGTCEAATRFWQSGPTRIFGGRNVWSTRPTCVQI